MALDYKRGMGLVAAVQEIHNPDKALLEEVAPGPMEGLAAVSVGQEGSLAALVGILEGRLRLRLRLLHHHTHSSLLLTQNHMKILQLQTRIHYQLSSPWKVHISNAPL